MSLVARPGPAPERPHSADGFNGGADTDVAVDFCANDGDSHDAPSPKGENRTAYGLAVAVSRSRKARAARRRQLRMRRVEHDLSDAQWAAIQAAWGGCAYCGATGTALQRDCLLALSRGGRYTLDNVVPACRSCNASKCNDEVTGWLRRTKRNERAFLLRHARIAAALSDEPVPGRG
jgi:5-methylcytosine-specific restriction endonuclease McrA